MAKSVHVSGNRSEGYRVTQNGREIGRANTQREAIDNIGRPAAQRANDELFIHRPNGQIRERDSFGNDPYPPKG